VVPQVPHVKWLRQDVLPLGKADLKIVTSVDQINVDATPFHMSSSGESSTGRHSSSTREQEWLDRCEARELREHVRCHHRDDLPTTAAR